MRRAWLCAVVGFFACKFDDVDLTDRPCPCLEPFVCDAARNRCVPATTLSDDGGIATGFTAEVPSDVMHVVLGSTATVKLSVQRQPWFQDALLVGALDPPPHVTVPAVTLAPDQSEAVVAMSAAADAKVGFADMKLAVTGGGQSVTLPLRLQIGGTPGAIDTSFGNAGTVSVEGNRTAAKLVEQPDGKIVSVDSDLNDFTVRRFNSDGSVDTGFGTGGKAIVPWTSTGVSDLALQPDGAIVVVGATNNGVTTTLAAARVTSNGQLDPTFGSGGKLVLNSSPNPLASALAIQTDGKILLGGGTAGSFSVPAKFMAARLLPTGSLDSTFAGTGMATIAVGSIAAGSSMVLQGDGKIALAGYSGTSPETCTLVRYLPGGTLDTSFGNGGIAVFSPPEICNELRMQSSGRFIALGASTAATAAGQQFMLTRYETTGAPDATFGSGGKAMFGGDEALFNLALQADDKIVVGGGGQYNSTSYTFRPLLRRMTKDGAPDETFGTNGSLVPDTGNTVDALLILRDGRAIVALSFSGGSSPTLLRLWM